MAPRKTTNSTAKQIAANNIKARTEFLQTNPVAINYQLRSDSIALVSAHITKLAEAAGMSADVVQARITAATSKTEYGKVPSLINLMAAVSNWPLDKDEPKSGIVSAKAAIMPLVADIVDILEDVRIAKGYHSFLTDDHTVMNGVEPDFEEYRMLIQVIAAKLDLQVVDLKLDEEAWDRSETSAILKANKELELVAAELEEHLALHGEIQVA